MKDDLLPPKGFKSWLDINVSFEEIRTKLHKEHVAGGQTQWAASPNLSTAEIEASYRKALKTAKDKAVRWDAVILRWQSLPKATKDNALKLVTGAKAFLPKDAQAVLTVLIEIVKSFDS